MIMEELKKFNWMNPSEEEINNMIDKIENNEEDLTEDEEIELADCIIELEEMKTQHEYDEWDYYDDHKEQIYYGMEC